MSFEQFNFLRNSDPFQTAILGPSKIDLLDWAILNAIISSTFPLYLWLSDFDYKYREEEDPSGSDIRQSCHPHRSPPLTTEPASSRCHLILICLCLPKATHFNLKFHAQKGMYHFWLSGWPVKHRNNWDFVDTWLNLQQVEEQAQRIADLKESLAQKEALYLATCEKLCSSENKRIELETSLVSLATSDVVDGKKVK